jgi:hypothetical protein
VLVWAHYATLLGYFGGRAFEHARWMGLLLSRSRSLWQAGSS